MSYSPYFNILLYLPMFLRTHSEYAGSNDTEDEIFASNELTNTIEDHIHNEIRPRSTNQTITSVITSTASNPEIPNRYPFMVSIQLYEKGKYKHLCAGIILEKYFVITVAHCTLSPRQLYAKDLFVIAGSNTLYDRKSIRFRVQELRKHSNFKPFYSNDIMLLQLASAIPLDNLRFSAIDFRHRNIVDRDLDLILLGWGRTKVQTPKDIEVVHFRTMSNAKCFINYKFKYLKNGDICAINTKGYRGACDGDSGGPLIDEQLKSLYGVLSYGRKPCKKGKVFVFTRISEYIDWIKKQMLRMSARKLAAR